MWKFPASHYGRTPPFMPLGHAEFCLIQCFGRARETFAWQVASKNEACYRSRLIFTKAKASVISAVCGPKIAPTV